MPNQGIKSYGSYYEVNIDKAGCLYVNLSKTYKNIHFLIPIAAIIDYNRYTGGRGWLLLKK